MIISISICPTTLEFDSGDAHDEGRLLAAIREFLAARHPEATIACLQIGHRQGDAWAKIDGDSAAGEALMQDFWAEHDFGSDEGLFCEPTPAAVEFAVADETIRGCGGLSEFAGLEHHAMPEACAAYRQAAIDCLRDDPRASRLEDCAPRGQRVLHSQWAGSRFSYSSGAIGTMAADLTADEKAAISAADDAGREAARKVIADADAAEVAE